MDSGTSTITGLFRLTTRVVATRRVALGAFVSTLVLVMLFGLTGLDWNSFRAVNFSLFPLMAAFAILLPDACLRAVRMRFLLPPLERRRASLPALGAITVVQQAAGQLIPARLGDLSYAFLMRVHYGTGWSVGLSTTLFMRLADFSAFGLVLFIATGFAFAGYSWTVLIPALLISLLFCLGGGWGLVGGDRALIPLLASLQRRMKGRFAATFEAWQKALQWGSERRRDTYAVLGASLLLWLLTVLRMWALGAGVGLDLGALAIFVAAAGGILTALLPVASPANLGTMELGWVSMLMLQGVNAEEALVFGLAVHLLLIGMSVSAGVLAMVALQAGWIRTPLTSSRGSCETLLGNDGKD